MHLKQTIMGKRSILFGGIGGTLIGLLLLSPYLFSSTTEPQTSVQAVQKAQINWLNFAEAQAKIKENPKKIFVDLYTDWCGWCKVMDKKTFSDPKVIDYINKHYYAVKFDGEYKGTVNYGGQDFKFVRSGRTGYHELAAVFTEGRLGYPTIVLIDQELKPITYLSGFQSAEDLMDVLIYIKEGLYVNNKMSFESFKKKRATSAP